MSKREIDMLGNMISMTPCSKEKLRAVSVGERMSYDFYDASFSGLSMLFIEPKRADSSRANSRSQNSMPQNSQLHDSQPMTRPQSLVPRNMTLQNPTPRECRITADRLSALMKMPVVFLLAPGPTYERQRLMAHGVYFIMSDKYAHLPSLVALERASNRSKATALTPVAQYLLLYHLQVHSLEGVSARDIAPLTPYSYESVTLGLTCLADLGLGEKVKHGQRSKVLHFNSRGFELWNRAQHLLGSPVEQRLFCDAINSDVEYPTCGVNALSHYSPLNPDPERMIMMTSAEYRSIKGLNILVNPNVLDGDVVIEVWRYPAVKPLGEEGKFVDKLSLALSLRDNHDPRVEKEVEQLINDMQWMG